MNRQNVMAFTLIEMLVVVVILGVILAIAIPSVTNLANSNRNKLYNTHMDIVEEKTKLFIDKHKGRLISNSASCFQVNYANLLEQDFLIETDVKCTGSIIITKSGNNRSFSSDYYLNCTYKGDKIDVEDKVVPTGCTIFDGN